MPPITAMARGCNICEPAPMAKANGSIPRGGSQGRHQDGTYPAADARRPLAKECGVGREQLDLYRLRRVRQIADHVLQHLHELDLDARLLPRDAGAKFRHDLLDVTVALTLELDGNVPAVGLGDCGQAKFQAGTARCTFDFGDFAISALK